MIEETQDILNTLTPIIVTYGLDIIGTILILVAGYVVANWLSKRVYRVVVSSAKIDPGVTERTFGK